MTDTPQAIRVMHFADTHFGVELYGRLDPETGVNTRLLDFKKSLLEAIDKALEANIHLAVFAGDAYKARDPRQTEQREFASCIRKLTDAGIPVVLLAGNHDLPAIKGRASAVEIYRTLGVTNVTVVSKPEVILIQTAAGPVRICGMPTLMKGVNLGKEELMGKTLQESKRLQEDRYSSEITRLAKEAAASADSIPTILMGHFWVNGAKLSSWQAGYFAQGDPQVPLAAMLNPQFDYAALGHIHRHQNLNAAGYPPIVYCGSPDRIDFGEREESKGFVIFNLKKGQTHYEFIPLTSARELIEIDVDADTPDPTSTIIAAIKARSLRGNIVRLTYRIPHEKLGSVREKEVREALSGAFMVVSIVRKVQRGSAARNRLLTETRTPREALELYIDSRPEWQGRKEKLLEYAEPLISALNSE